MPVSRVIETLASGMIANEKRHNTISNNLANVNTVGFKKDITAYTSFASVLSNEQTRRGTQKSLSEEIYRTQVHADVPVLIDHIKTAHSQGDMRITGNNFDLALAGKGFFAIKTPEGTRYTRAGNFILNSNNELVTNSGDMVLAVDEKMRDGVPVIIHGKSVNFVNDGTVQVDGIPTAQLRIVDFDDYEQLEKVGHSLFAYNGDARGIKRADDITVESGYIEGSNVNAVSELTTMIANSRHYEISGSSFKGVEQTISRAIADLGKFK